MIKVKDAKKLAWSWVEENMIDLIDTYRQNEKEYKNPNDYKKLVVAAQEIVDLARNKIGQYS